MKLRLCLLFFVTSFFACKESGELVATKAESKNSNQLKLTELDWMLGKWKRENTDELELWSKREDSFYGGMMVKLKNDEKAVIQEVLSLEGKEDGIYYAAKVNGQNNGQKVLFKMSNSNFNAPKFSNMQHDFPNHISYMKIGKNKIKVEIAGNNGNDQSFYYHREM